MLISSFSDMKLKDVVLKGLRKTYRKLSGKVFYPENYILDRQIANDLIFNLLSSDRPCMISRFGSGEIGVVMNYLSIHEKKRMKSYFRYIFDDYGLPWWDELFFKSMRNNMGVFPENVGILEKFAQLYLNDTSEIDLLGSMNYTEKYMPLKKGIQKVHIESLYPFFVEHPWTRALKGKKVLVVHPFIFSIQKQYEQRYNIFDNKEIWPNYNLITYRAIQSNAGAEVPYKDWFEALKKMEEDIDQIDFDIAILGCGAYGLPLAAHIKRRGKKAIHLGGGSQLLFGIKGRRWEDEYYYQYIPKEFTDYRKLFNEYWTRPNEQETPKMASNVEGACYW